MSDETEAAVESVIPEQPQEATVEQREDEVLMRLDGADEDAVEEESQPEAVADDQPVEQQPEQPEQAEDTPKEASADLEDAWSILRRDGFDRADLAALSDEAILRLAAHRKKVQGDVDRMLSEAKKANEEVPEQSQAESDEPTTAEATSDQPEEDNLLGAARLFADHVGLDDEGTKLLAKSYEAIVQPFASQLQQMQMQMAAMTVEAARRQLVDQYPQVADTNGEGWQKVVARMNKMSTEGSYDTVEQLMEDAIAFEFRDQYRSEAQSAQQQIRNLRTNGSPSRPQGAAPEAVADADQLEDQILALLESDAPDRLQRARMLGGR